jgi:phosphoglycerol transferase MdoB-like AlkP superfamily enzyme
MESFAASHTGVLGSNLNLTPEFDHLSREGVLFSNLFSKGSRTNRALSGTLLSFPALPRLIAITKDPSKQQPYSCLAQILKQRNYQSHFLFGGNLAYDNMRGFFTPQGFDYFHSEPDFAKSTWRGHWGVDDHQLFNKAIDIIQQQPSPLLLTIKTSTNHDPYQIPSNNDFKPYDTKDHDALKSNAFRYSDWALGQFMQQLKKTDQYDNTIFVILGDHGFSTSGRQKTLSLSLETYHTAGLIIAPELTPGINARIAGQVDIIPSVLALLGGQWRHQSWGKNLFTEPSPLDFATFAPSGLNHQMGIVTPTSYMIHDFIGQSEYYRHNGHAIENNLRKIKQIDPALQATEERILEFTKLASHALDKKLCGIEA